MVGLALLRTVPATSAPAGPSNPSSSSAARPPSSAPSGSRVPAAAAMASTAARTVGISRTGHWYAPILATASASRVTAFAVFGLEPCPARPRAVSFSQAVPRSAEAIG